MRGAWAWVVIAGVVVGLSSPARAQNVKAHKAAAERALVKERYCEALFLYQKLDQVDPNAEWALQAADAAQFADDRQRALALYKDALARARKHPRARAMETSIAALEKLIARSGNGTACATPAAECGNGLIESGESCDDGNRQGGDSCPATCAGGAAVVLPPVPPPVGTSKPPPAVAGPPVASPVTPPAGPPELCTLIKPVKMFAKGVWKSLEFGATVTIKSRGPQWILVETPQGAGKIAASSLEGACHEEGAGATSAAPPSFPPPPAEPAPTAPPHPPPPTTTAAAPPPPALEPPAPEAPAPEPPAPEPPAPEVPAIEPAPEPEPTPEPSPEPAPPVVDEPKPEVTPPLQDIEPLRGENEPAAEAPVVEKSGGGLGGWIMLGVGAALVAGGGATAAWGALPYFDYAAACGTSFGNTDCPELDAIAADYQAEDNDDDRAALADDAADLRTDIDNAAQAWDTGASGGVIPTGRFVMAAGAGTAGVGVALMVGGLIWAIAAGGDEPAEDGEEEQ